MGFNPYFIGSTFRRHRSNYSQNHIFSVSILILLEVHLEVEKAKAKKGSETVSILILLEVHLEADFWIL